MSNYNKLSQVKSFSYTGRTVSVEFFAVVSPINPQFKIFGKHEQKVVFLFIIYFFPKFFKTSRNKYIGRYV